MKDRYDLLGMLQKAQREGSGFTDEDLVSEFIMFYTAGMETTATLVTMALYALHQFPETLVKIRKEIDEVYVPAVADGKELTYDMINKMDYTQAVIKETLRFYPPAAGTIPRIAE